jgi:hypothetical protein
MLAYHTIETTSLSKQMKMAQPLFSGRGVGCSCTGCALGGHWGRHWCVPAETRGVSRHRSSLLSHTQSTHCFSASSVNSLVLTPLSRYPLTGAGLTIVDSINQQFVSTCNAFITSLLILSLLEHEPFPVASLSHLIPMYFSLLGLRLAQEDGGGALL